MFIKRRKLIVLFICTIIVFYGFGSTYLNASAKSKSGYTKKIFKLNGTDKNGDRISVSYEAMRLCYNKKDKLCVPYYLDSGSTSGKYYVRSWSAKGKVSDRVQKCEKKYLKYLVQDTTKISDNGTVFSVGWEWLHLDDEKNMRPAVNFNAVSRKGKLLSHFRLDKSTSFFEPGPLDVDGVRREFYEIMDFEINGKYVDIIFGRTDDWDFGKSNRYSLQRFHWKTGKLVSYCELPRPCQRLCKGYAYGTDMRSFYKYSRDGKACLWESVLPEGKASVSGSARYAIKQDYDVIKGKLFYSNNNGVFMLNTSDNNSKPKKLITVKDCPELDRRLASVMDLMVVNENHFYLLITNEVGGSADVLYQYMKK